MNKRDKKVFRIAFKEGYIKGNSEVKVVTKTKIVEKPVLIIKASNDEKRWEHRITQSTWVAVIALLLLMIMVLTMMYYEHQYRKQVMSNILLSESVTYSIERIRTCEDRIDTCEYEKAHQPIINGLEVLIVRSNVSAPIPECFIWDDETNTCRDIANDYAWFEGSNINYSASVFDVYDTSKVCPPGYTYTPIDCECDIVKRTNPAMQLNCMLKCFRCE